MHPESGIHGKVDPHAIVNNNAAVATVNVSLNARTLPLHQALLDRFGGAPGWGDFVVGTMVMKW